MVFEQVIFIVLGVLATLSAIGMISVKDPVHCALLLVFSFFNLAGIYVLLGAEFLAAIQVLVYAGAIVVLFLFVMMLLQVRPGPSLNRLRFFQSRFGPVLALGFLVEVLLVVFASSFFVNGGKITDANNTQAQTVYKNVKYSVETFVPTAAADGTTVGGSGIGLHQNVTGGHPALLGKELYSSYLLPFEVASLILLIAAIGAIVIARQHLEFDTGEEGQTGIGRGISLSGAVPGSPQAEEIEKAGEALPASPAREDRKVILRK
ncbi:MAG TPA: NADH-quinone oxidoreductase subunit J [Chloroflexia bacterium]|nr:NADH-quinone oxidoreductase subunit J [Chloroflexia bacterium]